MIGLLDPTRKWESVPGLAPDPNGFRLSSLPFGSPVAAAQFLGKPDEFEWLNRIANECTLLYAAKGLRLRFEEDKLVEVSYLIGKDACSHAAYISSKPLAPDGSRMTPDVDRSRIVSIFGEPDPQGSDEECLQVFHGGGMISDFYLDEQGHLREWDLYPDD